jgi:hypothetical protein
VLGLVEIYQGKNSKSGSHMRAGYLILTVGRRVGFFHQRASLLCVLDMQGLPGQALSVFKFVR